MRRLAFLAAITLTLAGCGHTTTRTNRGLAAAHSGCFTGPGVCGYPGLVLHAPGAGNCSKLAVFQLSDLPAGGYIANGQQITITQPNVTVTGKNVTGYFFYVDAAGFTLDHDCVTFNGSLWGADATAVWGAAGVASGLIVKNSTLIPPGCSAAENTVCSSSAVSETAITSGGSPNATITNNLIAGAVEDINGVGPGSIITGNWINANGFFPGVGNHNEAVYENSATGITITDNTLLDPFDQSAVIFDDDSGTPCLGAMTITGNLIAGGGYPITACAASSLTVSNNDFASCTTGSTYDQALGGHYCGQTAPAGNGSATTAGMDAHGYWPAGGFFGLAELFGAGGSCNAEHWAGNVTDAGAAVACP